MKIYLYCPDTGIYQGEDFADAGFIESARQSFPDGCTTIAPPAYRRGEVAVFDVHEERWAIRSVPVREDSAEDRGGGAADGSGGRALNAAIGKGKGEGWSHFDAFFMRRAPS